MNEHTVGLIENIMSVGRSKCGSWLLVGGWYLAWQPLPSAVGEWEA